MAGLFGFNRDQIERIAGMLRDYESGATIRPNTQRRRPLPAAIRLKIGKLKGVLTQGGTQDIDVWTGTTETDSGDDINAKDWMLKSGESVASGKKVTFAWVNGRYYVIAGECA